MRNIILATLLLFYSAIASAQTWADAVIAKKKEVISTLNSAGLPYSTDVMRKSMDAQKIDLDVSEFQDLVLFTYGTEDGTSYDQSAWGDAKLIDKDGNVTYIDEMVFKHTNATNGTPFRNRNFAKKPLSVNGKVFEKGICLHSHGEVVIELGGKYSRFVAEVGIDDNAGTPASVNFMIYNISSDLATKEIIEKYPETTASFMKLGELMANTWLTSDDGDVEKKALLKIVKLLEDPTYYTSKIEAVSGDSDSKIKSYLEIFEQINEVLNLQSKTIWVDIENVRNAFEDMKKMEGYDIATNTPKMAKLEAIYKSGIDIYSGSDEEFEHAKEFVKLAREILLTNPILDIDKIIVGKYTIGEKARGASAPMLGTQPNNWSNQTSSARQGHDAEIVELSNIRGDKVKERTIFKPEAKVAVSDLMLHWDADRILFTSVGDMGLWNIFEVNVDGSGYREVVTVDDKDLEFFDATYLPSGKIIANSNIGYQGVPCINGGAAVGNMVLFDPETNNIRRLTFDQDANWHPNVMNNGKVMYVRWEYTDLTHYYSRITMHMNPDGTEQKSLYGSGGFFPNSTFDVRPLPNSSSKFVGVISGHHGTARAGRLMIFDPAKSRDKTEGIIQEIPFSKRPIDPIIKDQLIDGVYPQFLKPNPISDNYFLVSVKPSKDALWGIYLVDIYDNMTLITEQEGEGFICANLVQKRKTPPVIPDRVNLADKESTVYIQDIYEGEGLPGVERGTVKKLRLFAYEYAYLSSPSNHYAQGIQSGWDIKRLLGEVDVNEDGSATFKIPANTPISIQPLDSEGRALQWMRSWLTGMPGETVSCVGCHEDQNSIPVPKQSMASRQSPQSIEPWDGYVRPYTFKLEMQPILDRACIACHNENSGLNFTDTNKEFKTDGQNDTFNKLADGGRNDDQFGFSESYLALHPYVNRQGPEADALVMKPYEYHASTSELVQILKNGHHGVELTDREWRSLYAWIDMNAPYYSAFFQNEFNGYNQIKRRQELSMKYNDMQVDWEKEINDYAEYLASKPKIVPVKPDYTAPVYKDAKAKNWPFTAEEAAKMQGSDNTREIEVAPGVKMVFRKIPAGEFVMGSNEYGRNVAPESKVKIAKSFWIGEIEVTNAQYNALVPEHDSRYIAQHWKDHVLPGYPANRPEQPVIRVSYNDVMEYCKMLSDKTGLNITIPNEAQWEWAARGGSDGDFWFGSVGDNYAEYDNMADVMLEDMAVSGVDPRPMSKTSPTFKYANYLPKNAKVNDGNMLLVGVGDYKANPWGLQNMNGNVREWTSSDYIPYPYSSKPKESSEWKVVRGGSWIDRDKNSTSYTRKSGLPWQPFNNVGFRLIIEE